MNDKDGVDVKKWLVKLRQMGMGRLGVIFLVGVLLFVLSSFGRYSSKEQISVTGNNSGENGRSNDINSPYQAGEDYYALSEDRSIFSSNSGEISDVLGYEAQLEQRLREMICRMSGTKKVSVMVTVKQSGERVHRKEKEQESETTQNPIVQGVLIVMEGGDDPEIKREINEAVQALFDVPSHKIKIIKM